MWVFGFHPVREALRRQPEIIERVLIARSGSDRRTQEIADLCDQTGVDFHRVTESEISRRFDGVHNGLAAELSDGSSPVTSRHELVVLAEDVQDPRNLGALIRVCDAAGVDRLLVRDRDQHGGKHPAAAATDGG